VSANIRFSSATYSAEEIDEIVRQMIVEADEYGIHLSLQAKPAGYGHRGAAEAVTIGLLALEFIKSGALNSLFDLLQNCVRDYQGNIELTIETTAANGTTTKQQIKGVSRTQFNELARNIGLVR